MNRLFSAILCVMVLFVSTPTPSFAQAGPGGSVIIFGANADPCQNSAAKKFTSIVNISSATTTQLVAAQTGTKQIRFCGGKFSASGTGPTALFVTGTGTNCGTGTTSLTGTIAIPTGTIFSLAEGLTNFTSPALGAVCLTSGGTGPNFQGFVIYTVY